MQEHAVAGELRSLQPIIEEITGLDSRWNGTVQVLDAEAMLLQKGKVVQADKEWSCTITVNAAVVDRPERWRSLIHEMLHAVSAGVNREDYGRFKGWEEGVVESVQRQIRPRVLERLDVKVPETTFALFEETWPYNGYIAAMEELRWFLGIENERFYLDLLRIPLSGRIAYVHSLDSSAVFIRLLATVLGKLR